MGAKDWTPETVRNCFVMARRKNGVSQQKMADMLHVSRGKIARMEQGQGVLYSIIAWYLNNGAFLELEDVKRGWAKWQD